MAKELAKTYDPKGMEDRLYQKWLDKEIFPCRGGQEQKTFHDCDSASKYYGSIAYGACFG